MEIIQPPINRHPPPVAGIEKALLPSGSGDPSGNRAIPVSVTLML